MFPSNLHVSVSNPASGAPPLRERVEQKFFVAPGRESLAFALLRRTCREDPEYPVGQVNSLYFDTADLDQHQRSDSGEYEKDKIRVRWYGETHDPHRASGPLSDGTDGDSVSIWLELKSRRGFASTKQRVCVDAPQAALAHAVLGRGIVSRATLMRTITGFGFFSRSPLHPVIAISYWRYRFVEPRTGFRISIDSRIRSSTVMPGIGSGERGLELPGAIVEIKGAVFDVPSSLRPIAEIGSSWTRYSKYSSSLDGHAAPRGTVSRLWPSGVMDVSPDLIARGGTCRETREPRSTQPAVRFIEEYETE